MIISIEGIDGSGKTTLARQLYEWYGARYPIAHFPTERAARYIDGLADPHARALAYAADFFEYEMPRDVILDRYTGSHYAHCGRLSNVRGMTRGLPVPDITFLCVSDVYDCFERRNGAHSIAELEEWQARFYQYYKGDPRCVILNDESRRFEQATGHIISMGGGA